MAKFKFNYKNDKELNIIMEDNKHLYLIEDVCLKKEKYVVFTDIKPEIISGDAIYTHVELLVEEQSNKISILESENLKLLLDSAIKTNEIDTLNKNTANLTLEIAKMKGTVE